MGMWHLYNVKKHPCVDEWYINDVFVCAVHKVMNMEIESNAYRAIALLDCTPTPSMYLRVHKRIVVWDAIKQADFHHWSRSSTGSASIHEISFRIQHICFLPGRERWNDGLGAMPNQVHSFPIFFHPFANLYWWGVLPMSPDLQIRLKGSSIVPVEPKWCVPGALNCLPQVEHIKTLYN